jgi:hypothetical protein
VYRPVQAEPAILGDTWLVLSLAKHQGSPPIKGLKSILTGSPDRIKCFCYNIVSIKGIVIF